MPEAFHNAFRKIARAQEEIPEHPMWNRTEDEIVFLRAPAEAKLDYEIDFGLFVAIDKIDPFDSGPFDGRPVLRVLDRLAAPGRKVARGIQENNCVRHVLHRSSRTETRRWLERARPSATAAGPADLW